MIEIDGLSKTYGTKEALSELTLTVEPGEVFAFLGPNGAGKTTTIKLLAGLLRPTAGTARVCGHDIRTDFVAAKASMGYVPDEPYLYEKLTGREFLRFVGSLHGFDSDAVEGRIGELVERFDTGEYIDELAGGYSHGMKQRVVISAALLHGPKALVIDEPMVGLDPKAARVVKDTLRERSDSGASVFVSTHTLSVAEEIADHIGIINYGRLVAAGTMGELRDLSRNHGDIEDLFLDLTAPTEIEEPPAAPAPRAPSSPAG